jgi:hypothetical protein
MNGPVMAGARRRADPADILVGVLQCRQVGAHRSWELTGRRAFSGAWLYSRTGPTMGVRTAVA